MNNPTNKISILTYPSTSSRQSLYWLTAIAISLSGCASLWDDFLDYRSCGSSDGPCPEQPCAQSDLGCETMAKNPAFKTVPTQIVAGQTANENLGTAVSVTANWLAVGAYGYDMNKGLVKLYKSNSGNWNFFSDVTSPFIPVGNFGTSVSMSDEFLAVGSPNYNQARGGSAIYRYTGTQWVRDTTMTNDTGTANDRVGYAVGVSGSSVVVGADGKIRYQGAASVYARQTGGAWQTLSPLTASAPVDNDQFGTTVAIFNETVLIGAPGKIGTANDKGAAHVFIVRGAVSQSLQAELAPDGGAAAGEHFGYAVAVQDNLAVIGAIGSDGGRGAVYLFSVSGGNWKQTARLVASSAAAMDSLGTSVAISGDTIVAGAANRAAGRGSAYVFVRSGGVWSQQSELVPSDGAAGDGFGSSVAVSGPTAVIGAPNKNGARGAFYIFTRPSI